jgi:hypothetical protein
MIATPVIGHDGVAGPALSHIAGRAFCALIIQPTIADPISMGDLRYGRLIAAEREAPKRGLPFIYKEEPQKSRVGELPPCPA